MDEQPRIELAPNGPFMVHNLSKLTNAQNETLEEKPMHALCRCGASKNKPFCDGQHTKVGFTDE